VSVARRSAVAAPDHEAILDDPALREALAACALVGRLSTAEVRAMRAVRKRSLVTGVAVLVAGLAAGGWWGLRPAPAPAVLAQHFETGRGQQREIRLADGSMLRLNGATRIDVRLAADRRDVRLVAGEAFFDVAHDPARPFIVHAGASEARVLGTAFDVNLMHDQVGLSVYRGAVRFGMDRHGEDGVVVKAGFRSRFRAGAARPPVPFAPEAQDWRNGWLDTDGMELGDLVDTLNRRDGPAIMAPPPPLAEMAITGPNPWGSPSSTRGRGGAANGGTR